MLSGVRIGKRKRKPQVSKANASSSQAEPSSQSTLKPNEKNENFSAAENLRRKLQLQLKNRKSVSKEVVSTVGPTPGKLSTAGPSSASGKSHVGAGKDPAGFLSESVSKRIRAHPLENTENGEENTIILSSGVSSSTKPALRIEDMRRGSRKGKLKTDSTKSNTPTPTKSISLEIQKMIQEETNSKLSMDEIYARNIARLGSKYKGTDFGQNIHMGASAGADEEDFHGDGGANVSLFQDPKQKLTEKAIYERETSKQIAQYQKQTSITSKCWWWMQSSSFRKRLLLSLGDHVSLVLVPKHLALVKGHCFLVPVKHAESFVSCDDEVWDEVQRFRTSIRSMYEKEGKSVLFCETVLSSKGLWQARMDIIPVPKHVEHDAPLHFKSALNEQAEEWGTHTKLLSTNPGGLRRTIPKSFPYVNIEWKDGGYAQIIETTQFPKDFLIDTIGSMMHLDPIRFQRKKRHKDDDEEERLAVLDFCARFKDFDWTVDLD